MRKAGVVAVILIFWIATAWAQGSWQPFETTNEARQRHSAERYQTYKEHNYQAPLGGYSEPLGDRAPAGTERPGFTSPERGQPSPYGAGPRRHNRWGLDEE